MSAHEMWIGILLGVSGTAVLDLWALFMASVLNMPATNWAFVGRWIGHMRSGRFVQSSIANADPVPHELAIGWSAHYLIGALYGVLLVALGGSAWIEQPRLMLPLALSWALLVAPFFVMMPGMGFGAAGAKTPNPAMTRMKSVIGHSVFGLGMYATGVALSNVLPAFV